MSPLSAPETRLIGAIDPAPILARTLDWAAINSGTGNLDGVAAMAHNLADAFASLPGEIALEAAAPVEQVLADGTTAPIAYGNHFVLRVRPDAARRVLLTGHMDTVFAKTHAFQQTRWLDDSTINGPGTADMKGGLSLMLEGLLAFESTSPSLGYEVLINSDEEAGSKSSAALIARLAKNKLAALTYEPALPGGIMARARPGSGNFAFVVRGRSAHAGRNPEDGRNALVAAADLAQRLHAARRPGLSVNPARIEGGGPNNIVPDLAVLHVNMRPGGAFHVAEAEGLMDRAVAEISRKHEVTVESHGGFNRPPKPITAASERLFALVHRAAGDLGEDITWKDTGGVCDGNNIAACGVPVIDTMGARGGAIHSPDEFLEVPSLAARARLTSLVMHRLDAGDLGGDPA
jgi:glutamate carboxypeptidase